MTIDQLERRLKSNLAQFGSLKRRVRFDFGADGALLVDAVQAPPALSRDGAPADCTIRISAENMGRLLDGTLDPTWAFTTGRLKVQGDMGLALKLAALLGD